MRYQEYEDAVGQCPVCKAWGDAWEDGKCPACGTVFNECVLCGDLFAATGRNTCDDCIRAELHKQP